MISDSFGEAMRNDTFLHILSPLPYHRIMNFAVLIRPVFVTFRVNYSSHLRADHIHDCCFIIPGAGEGEDRPLGRCHIEQKEDERTGGQPFVPADQHTGAGRDLKLPNHLFSEQ